MSGKNNERGSLVLVALCFTAVIGIALASYISVCYRSQQLSTREFNNKRARYLAEVGLEESLWALNNVWTTSGKNSDQTWTTSGADKTLTLNAGNTSSYDLGSGATGTLALTVFNYGTTPSLRSVATITLTDGSVFTKRFDATTLRASAFPNAIASSSGTVNFSSAGSIDSYDSSISAGYGGGNISYSGVIAGSSVSINNAGVKGYLTTYGNPFTNILSYTSGVATVIGSGGSGVDANRLGRSAYIPTFTVPAVSTGTIITGTTTPLSGGSYRTAGAYTNSGTTVNVNGAVKLYVNGDFSLSSTGRFQINAGGSLEIFVMSSGTVSVSGTGGIRNQNPTTTAPDPSKLALYITGNGAITWNTTRRFDGVIYATTSSAQPINVTNNGAVFYGALLSYNNIAFSGSIPAVHYDTKLRTAVFPSITTPFTIDTLSEVATQR